VRKRTRDIMGPVCDTPAKLAHWRLKELWNLGDLVTYRRELKKLITAAGRSEDTEFIGDATNVALFHLSSMTEAGRIDGVDRLLALLLPVIPEWADDRPVYNGFRLGLAYTISGGVRMHALAPKAALAAYRTAVTVLSARDSTPYYLVNALIRQGAAQIALGTAAGLAWGLPLGLLTGLALPVLGYLALLLLERWEATVAALRALGLALVRRPALARLRAERESLVAEMAALDAECRV